MTTTGSVLSTKLRRMFDSLDTDGDGHLTEHDFTVIADRLSAAVPAPTEKVQRLRSALMAIWSRHLGHMDYDDTEHIDPDEYERGVREAIVTDLDGFIDTLHNALAACLDILDTDDTGLVDVGMYTVLAQAVSGGTAENMAIAFAKLDRNGNGNLEHAEVRAAMIEYFTSEDPEARGNWLYGPL